MTRFTHGDRSPPRSPGIAQPFAHREAEATLLSQRRARAVTRVPPPTPPEPARSLRGPSGPWPRSRPDACPSCQVDYQRRPIGRQGGAPGRGRGASTLHGTRGPVMSAHGPLTQCRTRLERSGFRSGTCGGVCPAFGEGRCAARPGAGRGSRMRPALGRHVLVHRLLGCPVAPFGRCGPGPDGHNAEASVPATPAVGTAPGRHRALLPVPASDAYAGACSLIAEQSVGATEHRWRPTDPQVRSHACAALPNG